MNLKHTRENVNARLRVLCDHRITDSPQDGHKEHLRGMCLTILERHVLCESAAINNDRKQNEAYPGR